MPDPMTKVNVRRLQKLDQKKTFTVVLHASAYIVLTDLAKVLEGRGDYLISQLSYPVTERSQVTGRRWAIHHQQTLNASYPLSSPRA